jgi:RimJ/RimL family protein N-acetyltransferase
MITLAPFTNSDFDQLINWIDTEELLVSWSGSLFSFPLTHASLEWYIENSNVAKVSDAFTFKVMENNTTCIGHISLGGLSWRNKSARISRVLIGDSNAKGKGYCYLMMQEILKVAFDELQLHRVALGVYTNNKAAINCYLKSGFTIEGTHKDVLWHNQQYLTLYEMAIMEDEWHDLKIG